MKATGQPLRSPRPMSRQAHRPQRPQRAFRATLRHSVAAVAACFATGALANPTAPTVVNGTASFNQAGNLLTVTNSNGAVIHWNTFSIASGETTRFIQPSSASSVLNRVLGGDPSAIYGTLSSNGRVWLVNPAGILVGPGGSVYLVGTNVSNEGLITTPQGETILAAGQTVSLLDTATPGVKVEITGEAGNATNLGQIVAEAGRIGIAGVIVRNSGTLNASSAVSEGGKIFLRASRDAYVDGDGRIVATGTTGGRVEVLGDRVAVMDRAEIDASGQNGGGTILVGGDYQGKNPDIRNASVTFFGADATLKVDAQEVGAGGTAIVWADDTTRAYGTISARGGANGGDGGFVETSGKRYLAVDGIRVDTRAPRGATGTWLLDPDELTMIEGSGTDTGITGGPSVFSTSLAMSTIYSDGIQSSLGSTNVTLQTSGTSNGSISADGVSINSASGNSLTLAAYGVGSAAGDITITDSIFNVSGGITLLAGWNGIDFTSTSIADSGGNITITSSDLISGGTINLWAGGLITLKSDGSSSTVVNSSAGMNVAASGLKLLAGNSSSGLGLVQLEAVGPQTITINNGGTLEVKAGTGNDNEAWIHGGSQTITFTAGGLLKVTGGGGGDGNIGSIESDSSQVINAANVDIFLTGGSSGGDIGGDQINDGSIGAETFQTVYARNITIDGGSATYGGAGFGGGDLGVSSQYFDISGNLVMTGGSSANPDLLASPAYIGTEYGGNTVEINVGGSITLNGGSGAGGPVLIGSLTGTMGSTNVKISSRHGITATGYGGGVWLGVKELSGSYGGSATLRAGWNGLGDGAPSSLGGNLFTSGPVGIQTGHAGSILVEAYESGSATLGDITLGAGTMVSSGTVGVHAQGHNTVGGTLAAQNSMAISAGDGYLANSSNRGGNLVLTNTSNLLAGSFNLGARAGAVTPYGGGSITQAGSLVSTSGGIDLFTDRNLAINGSVTSANGIFASVGFNNTNTFGGNLSFGAGSMVSATGVIEMATYAGADALGTIFQTAGSSIASESDIGLYADGSLTLNGVVTAPNNLFLYAGLDNASEWGYPSVNGVQGGNIAFGAGSMITGGYIEMFANRGSANAATGNLTQSAGGRLNITSSALYAYAAGHVKLLGTTRIDNDAPVTISAGHDSTDGGIQAFADKQIQIASLIATGTDSEVELLATGAISANTQNLYGIEANISNASSGGIVINNHTTTDTQPNWANLEDNAIANRSVSFTHTGSDLSLDSGFSFSTGEGSGSVLVAAPTSNLIYDGASIGGNSAILTAGNTLTISQSSLAYFGDLALIAPVVDISNSVSANGNLLVAAGTLNNSTNSGSLSGYNLNMIAGNINGNSGAHFMASNMLNATVANNIVLADGAHFHAGGDINLTMSGAGSEVRLSNGSYMHADVPTTIHIDFITRTAGGIFIDGISTIANNGLTGFFVGYSMVPAVPGAGLEITYASQSNNAILAILDSNTQRIGEETEEERQRRLRDAEQSDEGDSDDANKPAAQCS